MVGGRSFVINRKGVGSQQKLIEDFYEIKEY